MNFKKALPQKNLTEWFKENKSLCILLLVSALIFTFCYLLVKPEPEPENNATDYAEYEIARVDMILKDNTEPDPVADGGYRGEQLLIVEVLSGQYKGEQLQVHNYVGPIYGGPVYECDEVVLIISTYGEGSHTATVFEFSRRIPLVIIVALFLVATVAVGGKTGLKSLAGLIFTLACLFLILLPALMKGAPTMPTVLGVCAFIAVVSLSVLGGVHKKSICAIIGTVSGTGLALLFGLLAQALTRIDGLRLDDVEALLQLRQTGTPIELRYLLVGGVVISALGAVMDVAMGISSALAEVSAADPNLGRKELFKSGMNIGRDMVGTMTNTLILAFLGSSFTLILFLYSLGLSSHQLISSAYLSIEVISGISSSVGVILSIPITALVSAVAFSGEHEKMLKKEQ